MDSSKHLGLGKGAFAAFIVTVCICVGGAGLTVYDLFTGNIEYIYMNIGSLVMYGIVLFYLLIGYKVPHGNMFRYSMLVYAILFGILHSLPMVEDFVKAGAFICTALIAHMAGRLHKKEESIQIIIIVEAILLVNSVFMVMLGGVATTQTGYMVKMPNAILIFNQPMVWACFSLSYLIRFRQHQEAGKNASVIEPED